MLEKFNLFVLFYLFIYNAESFFNAIKVTVICAGMQEHCSNQSVCNCDRISIIKYRHSRRDSA